MTEAAHEPLVKMSIADVEIVKVGDWKPTEGDGAVNPEMLAAIVQASKDPKVPGAPIKLGHYDKRFDGNPAFGWVKNLRLGKNGTSIYGDLVDIPYKLARMIPDYYQRRSAEILPGYKTSDGTVHPARLSALALLGAEEPAIGDLEAIGRLAFSASTPEPSIRVELSEDDVPHSPGVSGDTGNTSAGPSGSGTGKEKPMSDLTQFRALFGFGDDVTDEQLTARLQASGVLPAETAEGTETETTVEQNATGGTPVEEKVAETTANAPTAAVKTAEHAETAGANFSAGLPDGLTVIAQADLQALKLSAARADTLFQESTEQRHRQVVEAAFNGGKITQPERAVFLSALSENEKLAMTILDARPRLFSTSETGSPSAPTATPADEAEEAELERLASEAGI